MIEARLPDGTALRFPDGTADHVIDQAVQHMIREKQDSSTATGSALRGVVQGATFGFGDELRAGTDAAVQGVKNLFGAGGPGMGETYDQSLAASRGQLAADQEVHPVASIAGQVAGGVGGMAATGGAGAARLVVSPLARAAVGGGVAGGVTGFGEGEGGLVNRLYSGAVGAGVGAGTGAALGAAAKAVPAVAGRVVTALGLRDPEIAADRLAVRALERGGVSPEEAAIRLRGDSERAMVDVGGRPTVNLAATAANTPSRAMEVADRFVETRRAARPDRLMNAGDAAFGGGSGDDIAVAQAQRAAQRSAEADPLYRSAFGKPAGMTESIQTILDDPIGQQGLRKGLEIQRIENTARRARGEAQVPTEDPAIQYDQNGDPRIVGVPNMRSLDAVKRGMDKILEEARDPRTGRIAWDERLRAIDDMRRTWVELLDQGNPDYAAARAAWGGPSAQMEATQAGRTAFRTDRDIVAQRMRQGSPDVQEAYRLGAGRDFADRVSDPARASGTARLLAEDRQMQQRLDSLLPADRRAALQATLERERDMTAVERAVGPRANSQTGRILAGREDMATDQAGPWAMAINQLYSGQPIRAAMTVGGDVARRVGQGVTSNISDALANRLFVTDPAARQKVLEAMIARRAMDQRRAAAAARVIQPLVGGIATTSGGYAGR